MHKRYLILSHLLRHPNASQREISMSTGISLGQINEIIKELCEDGFLRSQAISKRKIRYVLTQRGLAERARFSNESILSTIKNYRKIRDAVTNLLDTLYRKGYKEFVLEGERGELHDVVSEAFNTRFADGASLVWGPAEGGEGRVILNLDRRFLEADHTINVLHEIAV